MWISDIKSKPIERVAIFGLGSMGRRYLSLLSSLEVVPPSGVVACDPDTTARSMVKGGWASPSVDATLDHLANRGGVDIVVIATPGDTHIKLLGRVTERFPEAGILVEKPLAEAANGAMLSEALKPAWFSRAIAVGYNWRFHPAVERFAHHAHQIADLTLYVADDMRRWPGRYGSPLYEFSHEVDLVRVLTRQPQAEAVTERDGDIRIRGTHQNGTWRVRIRSGDVPKGRWVRIRRKDGSRIAATWDTRTATIDATYASQLKNLLKAWTTSGRPDGLRCSLGEGVGTAMLLHEIETTPTL